jgi:hypothetical protein
MKNGCILCGKVGSGKSRTALCYFFEKECGGSIEPPYSSLKTKKDLYIITTARKRDDKEWDTEISAFTMFADDICTINIKIDSWNNIGKYTEVRDAFFIFDEQRVIGTGAWVTSFYKITSSQLYSKQDKNNHWVLLSATPGEKWDDYIPVFVANHFFRCKTDMEQQHAVYNPYTPFKKIDGWIYTDKLDALRDSILVDIVVAQNDRKYNWIRVDYDEEKYKYVTKKRWNIFDNEPIETAASYCYILRKVVNLNDNRLQAIKEIYDKHHKVIVFYNFDYELDILRLMCHKLSITKAEWNGHKHEHIPEAEEWLYLVQYTAGAEGWNCIETNVVVFFSLNYSYKVTEQASGRIDRRNTPFDVLYYYFLYTDAWIDRAIRSALRQRKTFNERIYFKNTTF